MNKTPVLVSGSLLRIGTVTFGPDCEIRKNLKTYSRLFKCRKNGFNFMGQIKIDTQDFKIDVEVFNQSYFEYFDVCRDEVGLTLKKKLLSKLLSDRSLSREFKETVQKFLDGGGLKNSSEREPKTSLNGKIDLQEMFDRLNTDYFEGKIKADLEWGKKVNKKNLTSFRFGSYDPEKKLIRIHQRLQQDFVPQSVLELTIYHEMCHQWTPMKRKKGMWVAHHPQFKEKEREYCFYEEARTWEKKNWKKLMRPVSEKHNKNNVDTLVKMQDPEEITKLAG